MFAPVYRPTKQASLLAQRRKEGRGALKRRRESGFANDDDEENGSDDSSDSPNDDDTNSRAARASFFHPINTTDPYHIAGHPRNQPLPPYPFPHRAAPEQHASPRSLEEELAHLKPPLLIPPRRQDDKATSFKRRHLDNLTAILHRSMLEGKWDRGFRAWALLLRTEIAGKGIDIRQHDRWTIGAELLMRQGSAEPPLPESGASVAHGQKLSKSIFQATDDDGGDDADRIFAEEGFKLAKEYYERLILQYPHTPRTQHHLNATAIYPALFDIWIYEVQWQSQRARRKLHSQDSDGDESVESDSPARIEEKQIRVIESEKASAIAQRLDDLLLSPPYDKSTTLLQLRGMVALWRADLYDEISDKGDPEFVESETDGISEIKTTIESDPQRNLAASEREKARTLFRSIEESGVELPRQAKDFLLLSKSNG